MEMKEEGRKLRMINLCIPKNRSKSGSLLERFRAVFFRFIMLSAISKGAQNVAVVGSRSPYPTDSHFSEAVADCIEFIKKSASDDEDSRDSTAIIVDKPLPPLSVM